MGVAAGGQMNPGGELRGMSGSHTSGGPRLHWLLAGAGLLRQTPLSNSNFGCPDFGQKSRRVT